MNIKRTVKKTGTSATGTIFLDRFDSGFLHLGMVGQPQIAVGAIHQHLTAVYNHFAILLT